MYTIHSVPLQCYYGFQFQLSQKLVIIAQNGGQGPDKHETSKKKYIWGGHGVPRGLFWGDFMVLQQKSLKISILRALKLIFFVNILYWHHKCIYQVVKYILGGQGAPRELFLRKFDGAATKNH